MLDAPAGYEAAARTSQRVSYSCDVVAWDRSSVLATGVRIDSGKLTVQDDLVRRQGSVRIVADSADLLPKAPGDLLHPYSHNLLRLRATVQTDAGSYAITLATCRMRKVDPGASRIGSTIAVELADDADEARIGRSWPNQLLYLDRAQESLEARITAILAATHPPALVGWSPPATGAIVPAGQVLVGPKSKTWEDIYSLARSLGWRLGVNALGAYDLMPLVSTSVLKVGGAGGAPPTVVAAPWDMRSFANQAVYLVNNAELGTAQATADDTRFPVTTPNTAGRWGIVWAYGESSDANPAAASTLAIGLRDRATGAPRSVSFQAVPDYRLEGADRVAIDLPSQGVVGTFTASKIDFDFTPGKTMQVACAEVRT